MDHIDNPPVIASASNYFSFGSLDPFSFDFSVPFDTPLPNISSFNTSNNDSIQDAQSFPTGKQPTEVSNPPVRATGHSAPLPVLGTPAVTATIPTSALKPQTDDNRHIAPLSLRDPFSTSLNGLRPQNVQNSGATPLPPRNTASTSSIVPSYASPPQENENIPPPPLPATNLHGKKRKSIPADETATHSKPKKARKVRPLPEKQKQIQGANEAAGNNQVLSVTNGVDPQHSSFANQIIPYQLSAIHPHRALDHTAQPNDARAILHPPIRVVKDTQHLQSLISNYGLPGVVEVDANKKYPTRILEMIVSILDPESQRTIGAYFFPYVWFPEDLKRPRRVDKDDRLFWGRRIYEYHHRVKCGRIAYTIAGSPVLFFTKEEKKKIDSINYHILVNSHRQRAGNTQNQVTQSLPGTVIDRGLGDTSLVAAPGVASSSYVDALPTEEEPPFNVQNNVDQDISTNATAVVTQQYQQSFPSSVELDIFADTQLNNTNNEADVGANTWFDFTNIPSTVLDGPSTDIPQPFPEIGGLTSNTFQDFQFNSHNNSAPNIDTSTSLDVNLPIVDFSSNFSDTELNNSNNDANVNTNTWFDLTNIPSMAHLGPSTDISQSFPEISGLASNTFQGFQFNSHNNSAPNIDANAPLDVTFNINDLPVIDLPPTDISQPLSELNNLAFDTFPECQFDNNSNDNGVYNVNTDTSSNFTFNFNDLPIIEQTSSNESIQSFPGDLAANSSFHFLLSGNNDNTASNFFNPDTLTNLAFNANDLPVIEQAPSTEVSQTFSHFDPNSDPTFSPPGVQQSNDGTNNEFDADAFLKLFNLVNSAEGTGSTVDPGPSIETSQSALEDMYTNFNWLESQDAEPSTSN